MASVVPISIKKVNATGIIDERDLLATEEPLEIRLEYVTAKTLVTKNISVTMRTPGNDAELATGFLYTEGIIKSYTDISSITHCGKNKDNVICVRLREDLIPEVGKLDRNFYTTSSCGVCGKASIESVKTVCTLPESFDRIRVPVSLIYSLPSILRSKQDVFENTGGLHACGLFDTQGNLLLMREDVGRHNALDKLIGASMAAGLMPLNQHLLLLSGRASFELVQKAVMAGINIVAAVGAPSSLAAEMAEEWGITLIGFLRGEHFNIYSGAERILI